MATVKTLLEDINAAPNGPAVAAIFDFDGTIIAGYSATSFIREQIRRGDISPRELVEIMSAMTSFGLGNLGFSGMMAVTSQYMRGIDEETYQEVGESLYTRQITRPGGCPPGQGAYGSHYLVRNTLSGATGGGRPGHSACTVYPTGSAKR